MMTLMFAAALAAAQPAVPGSSDAAPALHAQHAHGQTAEPKAMDCCKGCCKDMAKKHEGHSGH